MTTTTEKTVREIAIENPATIRVFETLGIDYCCGGRRSLSDACLRANVPMAHVAELLAEAGRNAGENIDNSWNDDPLHALISHIVTKHHAFVRQETPRIESLLRKVINRHGDTHPEVRRIGELFLAMAQELSTHMMKEERSSSLTSTEWRRRYSRATCPTLAWRNGVDGTFSVGVLRPI